MSRGVLEAVFIVESILIALSLAMLTRYSSKWRAFLLLATIGATVLLLAVLLTMFRDDQGFFHGFIVLPAALLLVFPVIALIAFAFNAHRQSKSGPR